MLHPDFLMKMVVRILITLTQRINDYRQPMMKLLVIRMANHPPYPFPYLSLLSLLPQPSDSPYNAPPRKHCFTNITEKQSPARLERGSKRCSLTVSPIRCLTGIMKILLVFIKVPSITLSLMKPLVRTSSHSPKNYGRNMQVGLMATPNQARK